MPDPDGGRLQRGFTKQMGQVKTGLLTALVMAQQNLKRLLAWAHQTGFTADPVVTMDVTDRGFVELDEIDDLVSGVSPPRAA